MPDAPAPEVLDLDALSKSATDFGDTLATAAPEHRPAIWGSDWSMINWARRAALDLVIHRADAAAALDADYQVAHDLAADTVDELLDYATSPGCPLAAELREASASIHLHSTDTDAEWFIASGPDGLTWAHDHAKADVAVRGSLADVARVFLRRLPAHNARVEVLGDAVTLDRMLAAFSWG